MSRALLSCLRWIVFGMLLPATALAASPTLGQAMAHIGWEGWATIVALAGGSGLGALLNRLKDGEPPRVRLFISSHMVCSVLAGVLGYFIFEPTGLAAGGLVVVIIAFGYAGATAIDRVVAQYVNDKGGAKP